MFVKINERQKHSLLADRPDVAGFPTAFAAKLDDIEEDLTGLFPSSRGWMDLGSVYLANGLYREARYAYEMNLNREAVRLLERTGQSERAAEIREIVKNRHDPPARDPWMDELTQVCFDAQRLSLLFEDWFKAGRIKEAFTYLERLEMIGQAPEKAAFLRGVAYSEMGKFKEAAETLEQSIRLGTEPTHVYPLLASCYIELKSYRDAQAIAVKGIALEPRSSSLILSLGIAEFELGKKASSINQFNAVLAIDSQNVKAMRYLSRIHGEIGDRATALKYLEMIRNESTGDFISRAMLGQHHLEGGDAKKAIVPLREALLLQPKDSKVQEMLSFAYMQLGNAEAKAGRYQEAIARYEEAVSVWEGNMEAQINRAQLFAALGDFAQAESLLKRLVTLYPNQAKAYLILGDILRMQEKREEAMTAWNKAGDIAYKSGLKDIENEVLSRRGSAFESQ